MMRAAFVLSLLLACAPALAAPSWCKVTDVRYIHAGQIGADWWVYWWCPDGRLQWAADIADEETSARRVRATGFLLGANPGWPGPDDIVPDSDPRVQALEKAMLQAVALDHDRPPKLRWSVAKNGTSTTRPSYPFADGVRGKTSNGRAPVGAPCDCERAKVVEGSTTYCAFDALAASGSGAGLGPAAPPTAGPPLTPSAPKPVSVALCRADAQ